MSHITLMVSIKTLLTKDANHRKIGDITANFKFSNTTENDEITTTILKNIVTGICLPIPPLKMFKF